MDLKQVLRAINKPKPEPAPPPAMTDKQFDSLVDHLLNDYPDEWYAGSHVPATRFINEQIGKPKGDTLHWGRPDLKWMTPERWDRWTKLFLRSAPKEKADQFSESFQLLMKNAKIYQEMIDNQMGINGPVINCQGITDRTPGSVYKYSNVPQITPLTPVQQNALNAHDKRMMEKMQQAQTQLLASVPSAANNPHVTYEEQLRRSRLLP